MEHERKRKRAKELEKTRGDWGRVSPRFFQLFRLLSFSLVLHYLNAWNGLAIVGWCVCSPVRRENEVNRDHKFAFLKKTLYPLSGWHPKQFLFSCELSWIALALYINVMLRRGLVKLGNNVAETSLRNQKLPSLAKRETNAEEENFASWKQENVFESSENFFVSRTRSLFRKRIFSSLATEKTIRRTMFWQQCFLA